MSDTCHRVWHNAKGKYKYEGWNCDECGAELPDALKKCLRCGRRVVEKREGNHDVRKL